ncbi:alpha/beta fold hydrolase [Streptomyces sp. GXMU-J15]|uniref:Alpha/beta fold hydrolase n=1 Tax=Streptomyces fuscus TaxID=3048495 RepID=A0ABT7JB19_9ACTN|nr:alpha/beta fold hydrolase [Streptomyces fuscus]MDL2082066.1 alpha/beta fold hydrolase [Streptomyces fuscus]
MGDGDRLCVVFVHGFNSRAKVWNRFISLIDEDPELGSVEARAFGYATGLARLRPDRSLPSLSTVADHLKTYLDATMAGRPLVLVGHSMGGLVIQRYLVRMLAEGRGRELARIRRVVLFACPNAGSEIARGARKLLLGTHPQERQLRTLDEDVRDTHASVLRDIVGAVTVGERNCPIPFSVFAAESDRVVPRASAQGAFPDSGALPGDHFSVVQPRSREHTAYVALRHLLREAASGSDPPGAPPVTARTAASLEVHGAPLPGSSSDEGADGPLTPYLFREHDVRLHEALARALEGGTPRLLVLTGESSTGKTRALYEALIELAPERPLHRPTTAADLLELLDTGQVGNGSVLWLNEAQRFFYGAGGEAAAEALHGCLGRSPGLVALATFWTHPYWTALTQTDQLGHTQARTLLTHPALTLRLTVPPHLSEDDLAAWADLSGDPRMEHALEAAREDGRVIQHLTGGPQLLDACLSGPGMFFTPSEHALISMALEARRLGHHAPMPPALLAQAADGVLSPRQRSGDPDWALQDLTALCEGRRGDGTVTAVHTLTALNALRPRSGAPAVFEPADYLDQHMRRYRADRSPAPALWESLLEHATDPEDLCRLGQSAWDRGLRWHAALLWRRAVLAGSPSAPALLVRHVHGALDPPGTVPRWTAAHCSMDNAFAIIDLLAALNDAPSSAEAATAVLRERGLITCCEKFYGSHPLLLHATLQRLRRAGEEGLVRELLDRGAATRTELPPPPGWTGLPGVLEELRRAGADTELATFLARRPETYLDPMDPVEPIWMLTELLMAGARETALEFIEWWDPMSRAWVEDAASVARLLDLLEVAGSPQRERLLACATAVSLTDAGGTAWLLDVLNRHGADDAVARLLQRDPARHADLTYYEDQAYAASQMADLLTTLRALGDESGVRTLWTRICEEMDLLDPGVWQAVRDTNPQDAREALLTQYPVTQMDPDATENIGLLLINLASVNEPTAMDELLALDPVTHADLTDPIAVAALLTGLQDAQADDAVRELVARNPAVHAEITQPEAVLSLLRALQKAGADAEAETLAERALKAGTAVPTRLLPYGCEPDGRPMPSWTWDGLPSVS